MSTCPTQDLRYLKKNPDTPSYQTQILTHYDTFTHYDTCYRLLRGWFPFPMICIYNLKMVFIINGILLHDSSSMIEKSLRSQWMFRISIEYIKSMDHLYKSEYNGMFLQWFSHIFSMIPVNFLPLRFQSMARRPQDPAAKVGKSRTSQGCTKRLALNRRPFHRTWRRFGLTFIGPKP